MRDSFCAHGRHFAVPMPAEIQRSLRNSPQRTGGKGDGRSDVVGPRPPQLSVHARPGLTPVRGSPPAWLQHQEAAAVIQDRWRRRMCVTHPLDPAIPKIPQSSDPRDLNPLPIPQSNPASRCRTPMPQSHAAGQTSGIGPLPSARVSRESVSGCAPRTTFFSSSCGPRAEPIQIRQRILLRWDLDRCADLRRQRRCVESCCCIASEEWEATHADHTC